VFAIGNRVAECGPGVPSTGAPTPRSVVVGGVKAVVAAGDADQSSVAERLGIKPEMVVQEIGWDEDVDDDVRAAIEEQIGGDILDEDADEVIDVVLLWWREDDGDLGDALIDARGPLEETGVIWVLTPKNGQPGHVDVPSLDRSIRGVATLDLRDQAASRASEEPPPLARVRSISLDDYRRQGRRRERSLWRPFHHGELPQVITPSDLAPVG